MKKGILLTAALAAFAPLAIVAGSAQAATDFAPQLVYTFDSNDSSDYILDDIVSFGDNVAIELNNGELWVSDGTESGTKSLEVQMAAAKVTSFDLERSNSGSESLDIDGVLYFSGKYDNTTDELFKTDGETVTRVTTGLGAWDTLYYLGGMIYVYDNEGVFQVNPTTGAYDEFYPAIDSDSDGSTQMQMVDGKILFIADGNDNDEQRLFAWDPATPNVDPVAFTASIGGLGSSDGDLDYMDEEQNTFTMFNGEMYFAAEGNVGDESIGNELFKTDGTQAGTVLVKDIFDGSNDSDAPSEDYIQPVVVGDEMFFAEDDGDLWKTDGTSSGTVEVIRDDSLLNVGDYISGTTTVFNGKIITGFSNDTIGDALYSTDGTEAGTTLLVDTNPTTGYSLCQESCTSLVTFEDHVFFIAYDNMSNNVWVTDGTPSGTSQVSLFEGAFPVGNIMNESLVVAGNNLFFAVNDLGSDGGTGERALYKIAGENTGGGGEGLATTGATLSANSLGGLVAMALVALAGAAVIARRRITTA